MRKETYNPPGILRVEQSETPYYKGKRFCITGGRDFADAGFVRDRLEAFCNEHHVGEIGFGCARGVDKFGFEWAKDSGMPWRRYVADWDGKLKAAGTIRNGVMLKDFQPDFLLVFPGGTGTTNCAKQAREIGIERIFIETEQDPLDNLTKWG